MSRLKRHRLQLSQPSLHIPACAFKGDCGKGKLCTGSVPHLFERIWIVDQVDLGPLSYEPSLLPLASRVLPDFSHHQADFRQGQARHPKGRNGPELN